MVHAIVFGLYPLPLGRKINRDFPLELVDQEDIHEIIAMKCLKLMLREGSLREDCCNLKEPGVARSNVSRQVVDEHLLAEV
jgi:hypothetical protein